MHLAGVLLSPGQEGFAGWSHPPTGRQLLICCRGAALGGLPRVLLPSPLVSSLPLAAAGTTRHLPWRGDTTGDGSQRPPGLLRQPSV